MFQMQSVPVAQSLSLSPLVQKPKSPEESKQHFEQMVSLIVKCDAKLHLPASISQFSPHFPRFLLMTVQTLQQKYEKGFKRYAEFTAERNHWIMHEIEIFIWLTSASPAFIDLPFSQYGEKQLLKLIAPFFLIGYDICEYLFKTLFTPRSNRSWTEEEDLMLTELAQKNQSHLGWGIIARKLFAMSDKRFWRDNMACRERWQNHLDPTRSRRNWSVEEDLFIVKQVMKIGKKWNKITYNLNSGRTQHNVKNRYLAILKRDSPRQIVRTGQQLEILGIIKKKLQERMKLPPQQQVYPRRYKGKNKKKQSNIRSRQNPRPEEEKKRVEYILIEDDEYSQILFNPRSQDDSFSLFHREFSEDSSMSMNNFFSFNRRDPLPNMFQYPILPSAILESSGTERAPTIQEKTQEKVDGVGSKQYHC